MSLKLEAMPYFASRSLILAPNIRQEKRFFSVLVCCTGSAVYLAGRHVQKIELELKILRSEMISRELLNAHVSV